MNIDWFKENIEPLLRGYEIKYSFVKNADFGDLESVEFNSSRKSGGLDFWSSGILGIDLVDSETGEDLMNFLIGAEDECEKKRRIAELLAILKKEMEANGGLR